MRERRPQPLARILSRLSECGSVAGHAPGVIRLLSEAVPADAHAAVRFDPVDGATLLGGVKLRIPPEDARALSRPGRLAVEAEKAIGTAAAFLSARDWDDPLLDAEGARHVALSSTRCGKARVAVLSIRRRGPQFGRSERERFAAVGSVACLRLAFDELEREDRRDRSPRPAAGLPGYSQFHDALTRELSRARRTGRALTVGVAGVVGLAGDQGEVLAAIASHLREEFREFDTIARHGAGGFVFVLPELAAKDAVRVTDRIADAVKAKLALPDPVRLVAGLACYPEDASTSERLIEVAEAVMAEGVEAGRAGAFRPQPSPAAEKP